MTSAHESDLPVSRIAWWLFGGLTCLYLLVSAGHIYSPDGAVVFRVTESLLDRGAADIQPLENWPTFGGSLFYAEPGAEPRFHAKYGLGQSLAAVPTVLLGRALAAVAGVEERGVFDTPRGMIGAPDSENPFGRGNPFRVRWDDWSAEAWPRPFVAWTASWTNAWVVGATAAVLFLLGCELGFGIRPSFAMAVLAGVATPLAHYARTFFSEPLAGLALATFVLLLVRALRRERGTRLLFAAGLALGACVLVKVAHAVLLAPALVLGLVLLRRRQRALGGRPWAVDAAWLAAGAAVPLLTIAAYNFARFGSPLETGYAGEVEQWTTPFVEGFLGLLASPGRGLLWFAPLVTLGVVFAPRFVRRFPVESAFVAGSLLALLVTYARWYMWEGGWCWGPRFLVPLVPLLMLPIGALFQELPRGAAPRASIAVAIGLALVVTVDGWIVNTMDFHNWVKLTHEFRAQEFAAAGVDGYYDLVRWDWRFSPLVAHWSFPVRDAFLLPHAMARPGLVLALFGLFAVGLAAASLRLATLLRAGASDAASFSGSEASVSP